MSYILDALRRADQERSLGEVPKLDLAMQHADYGERPSRWKTVLLIISLASLVAGAGWVMQQGLFDKTTEKTPTPSMAVQPIAAPKPAVQAAPVITEARTPTANAVAPQTKAPETDNPAIAQPLAAAPAAAPAPAIHVATAPKTEPSISAPPPAIEIAPVAPDPNPQKESRSSRLPAPTVAPAPPPNWARGGNAQQAPQEAAPQLPLTTYLGLPKSTRDSLPALNMNAHVFSTNPTRSFVLINNKRYRIGDYLAEGPALTDILPDGAVLEHRGETFLLPVQR